MDLAPLADLLQHLNEDTSPAVSFMRQQVLYGLVMLKAVVMDPSQKWVEDGVLKEVESLASNVASIISCFNLMGMEQDMSFRLCRLITSTASSSNHMSRLMHEALIRFNEVRKPLRETERKVDMAPLESLFEHLNKDDESRVMSPLRKRVSRELAFLNAVLTDPRQGLVEYGELLEIESMATKAGSIISAFELKNMDQDMALQLCDLLKSTLTPTSPFMRKARRSLQPSPIFYWPRIGELLLVDHLVGNLDLTAKVDSIGGPLKFYILRLQRKLQFLSCRLREIPEPRKEDADIENLMISITRLTCEAEFAIDSLLVRNISTFWCVFWLEDILVEFKECRRQVKMECGDTQSIVRSIKTCVGKGLIIIPIVKSQISDFQLRQVFNHHNIVQTFSVRTWSLASSYKERKKEFFLQLLNNVAYHETYLDFEVGILWHLSQGKNVPHCDKIAYTNDMSEDELKRLVARLLNRGPYFIILEDMPDMDVLNDIKRVLPNNEDGSRVLLSTRSLMVAAYCRYHSQGGFFSDIFSDHTSESQTNKQIIEGNVVGFKAETERMFEQLIRGPSKLHIILIVGMPGQDKTTLARKLYDDVVVVNYFHTRAWCYVSQV